MGPIGSGRLFGRGSTIVDFGDRVLGTSRSALVGLEVEVFELVVARCIDSGSAFHDNLFLVSFARICRFAAG